MIAIIGYGVLLVCTIHEHRTSEYWRKQYDQEKVRALADGASRPRMDKDAVSAPGCACFIVRSPDSKGWIYYLSPTASAATTGTATDSETMKFIQQQLIQQKGDNRTK
jgi:hypothetical protein